VQSSTVIGLSCCVVTYDSYLPTWRSTWPIISHNALLAESELMFFFSQNFMNNVSDGHREWDTLIRWVFISSRDVCSKWILKQLYAYQTSFVKVKCPWFIHSMSSLSSNKLTRHNVSLLIVHCSFCIFRVSME
jgi:hypothetical protein